MALFDRHTRTPFSSAYSAAVFPNQSPKPTVSQLPDHRIASTSSPPSYEPSKPNRKNSISKGLIRRLSLQKKPHRPSTPVYDHLASSGLLLSTQQQHQRDQTQRKRWEKRRSCVILPREEEGQEELPAYHCTVHKQGHVYVKREMEGPTQKTRWNRSWKPLYVELWGTLLFFYPLTTLHTTQEGDSIPLASLLAYRQTPPLETINLAHANATRAWDYVKRPHALRLVTDQGPHLLLRLDTHLEMVSWIEHLQAGMSKKRKKKDRETLANVCVPFQAINISLDLELRPMPKFMTLPTRVSVSNIYADPRALQFEHMREQRLLEQNEMLIWIKERVWYVL